MTKTITVTVEGQRFEAVRFVRCPDCAARPHGEALCEAVQAAYSAARGMGCGAAQVGFVRVESAPVPLLAEHRPPVVSVLHGAWAIEPD